MLSKSTAPAGTNMDNQQGESALDNEDGSNEQNLRTSNSMSQECQPTKNISAPPPTTSHMEVNSTPETPENCSKLREIQQDSHIDSENCTQTDQRTKELVFRSIDIRSAHNAINLTENDCLIVTAGQEKHKEVLEELFSIFTANVLKLRLNKSKFFRKENTFIGFSFTQQNCTQTAQRTKELVFSNIDIRSAHNAINLTENTSFLSNFILPDKSLWRFWRAPFGLKHISHSFNHIA